MSVVDGQIFAEKSDCYKSAKKMTPKGIVVHSTGCNNPNIKRYVAPDDGIIGENTNGNSMNEPNQDVCVHAIIGKDKNGNVKCYQILPWNYCCWGVGSGSKGSYNYDPAYIQFEMCEDGLTDKNYCKACYNKAVELCAYICKKYNISVNNIVSHHEAGKNGMGSSHIDPDNWWSKHGFTMDGFRKAVEYKI
ncbi:MAG: peptidoglycan recognition protein family protein [Ruminococcus sp.]|nr:peptidoglycan recognition protein family protein [Ruminococcus sp.]